jgi:hypothetical protein
MKDGLQAEQLFRKLTGARKPGRAIFGDAELRFNGEYRYVETKEASGDTVNQVRPMRFLPLAVLDRQADLWVVVPAARLVRYAATKGRGQHTEVPFECCTLSLRHFSGCATSHTMLLDAVHQAFREDDQNLALKQLMQSLREGLCWLSSDYRQHVLATVGNEDV